MTKHSFAKMSEVNENTTFDENKKFDILDDSITVG